MLVSIGLEYLAKLFQERKYAKAADLCPRIFCDDPLLWATWVHRFIEVDALPNIAGLIPTRTPKLTEDIYNLVLQNLLLCQNYQLLEELIEGWPSDIYDVPKLISIIYEEQLKKSSADCLSSSVAKLYEYNQQYQEALQVYIKLGSNESFRLLNAYNFSLSIQKSLLPLMRLDRQQTVAYFLRNITTISIDDIVENLTENKELLLFFLDKLFTFDNALGRDYHQLQVDLYASYDPSKLLPFLEDSRYYNLEEAYETCKRHSLVPEMVYLLGKIGDNKSALRLILDTIGDISKATEFAKEQNDEDLWEELVSYSLKRPEYIKFLLTNARKHIDVISLVERIPSGLVVPGLLKSLAHVLDDYHSQVGLMEACERALTADRFRLFEQLYCASSRGFFFDANTSCASCGKNLFQELNGSLHVFLCGHAYHSSCVEGQNTLQENFDQVSCSKCK
ncbi:vacuolar protein sorting-associated protein 41 homolog [Zophobas morio]|uniref:vacuolar protein sorting-associated protein 41 homolog n=1 Tax=Zophobas morio TaxID=2755281 RepID=UPI0030837F1D